MCFAAEDISVVASVDRSSVSFGDSFVYTIEVKGVQGGIQPNVPKLDGLRFDGPSHRSSTMIVNGQVNQSVQLQYAVTPSRMGDHAIPAIEVDVGGKKHMTQPIKITVVKNAMEDALKGALYAKVRFDARQVYIGQTAPIDVWLYVRQGVPLKGVGGFQCEGSDAAGYKFLRDLKTTSQVINGEKFTIHAIEGAIAPTKPGKLNFGPCAVQTLLQFQRKGPLPDEFPGFPSLFGNVETRPVSVATEPVPIEVLPLPEEGKPADFAGAVGQWNLEVKAEPRQLAVGEPVQLTVKISGEGNIDTVTAPKLAIPATFKSYDPTSKTTKGELGTTGERVFQYVVVPMSTEVKQLPEVQLPYFDPTAGQYKSLRQDPIKLVVKADERGRTTIVGGGPAARSNEKLGEDIVYRKNDLGPVETGVPFCERPAFWILNCAPVLGLAGAAFWKRRVDKLRGNVAYARRSRASKEARKLLAQANTYDQVQRALQSYLGDRLNIPGSGITASVVDERLVPRGLNGELAAELKACFEACDTARFAGGSNAGDVSAIRGRVEKLIDELEKKQI